MDAENERLRRRERELEERVAHLEARLEAARGDGLRRPGQGQQTSAASADLLFTAAEKTRMPQIITDPDQPDNPIVFANRAFQNLCGYDADELIGRNCRFLQGPGTDPTDIAKVRDAIAGRRDVVVEILNYQPRRHAVPQRTLRQPGLRPGGRAALLLREPARRHPLPHRRGACSPRARPGTGPCSTPSTRLLHRRDAVRRGGPGGSITASSRSTRPFGRQTGLRRRRRALGERDRTGPRTLLVRHLRRGRAAPDGRCGSRAARSRWAAGSTCMPCGSASPSSIGSPSCSTTSPTAAGPRPRSRRPRRSRPPSATSSGAPAATSSSSVASTACTGRSTRPGPRRSGWTSPRSSGARFDTFVHPDDLDAASAAFERVSGGGVLDDLDVRMRTRGRRPPLGLVERHPAAATTSTRPAATSPSEARLEEQLRQSQKLEAVGPAHRRRGPRLQQPPDRDQVLHRPAEAARPAEERRQRYIGAISDTVDRAAKLTGQLLAFARRQALRPEVFDVGHGVASVADMVGTLTGARIRVDRRRHLPDGEGRQDLPRRRRPEPVRHRAGQHGGQCPRRDGRRGAPAIQRPPSHR